MAIEARTINKAVPTAPNEKRINLRTISIKLALPFLLAQVNVYKSKSVYETAT